MKSKECFPSGRALPAFLASLFSLAVATATLRADAPTPSLDLNGIVKAAGGAPVKGARVFIYTAGPRVGPGDICPSCYADCRKSAETDAQGKFKIASLDPKLLFRVLVAAKGFEPTFATKVDPVTGPLEMSLEKMKDAPPGPKHRVYGRIIDPQGRPVLGARIEQNGVTRGQSTRWGGSNGFDPLAISDENGEFLLRATEPYDSIILEISARGLATTNIAALTGEKGWLIRMNEGAAVSGRLVKNGQPLAGVGITLSGKNRRSGEFTGFFDAVTDTQGRFHYFSIPAAGAFVVSAKMQTVREHGATLARTIQVAKDGETVQAGDLEVKPGVRLAGRVVLADGDPLPPGTKLTTAREEAWDSLSVELPPDGSFNLPNLPAESLHLSARVKGYRLSLKNPSLDRLNGFSVMGRLTKDTMGFILLLEPGERLPDEERRKGDGANLQPRDLPLRSAPLPLPGNTTL